MSENFIDTNEWVPIHTLPGFMLLYRVLHQ